MFNKIIFFFGRIEHQYIAFGAAVVLFIEVKRDLLGGKTRVDQIAQVLAEAGGESRPEYLVTGFLIYRAACDHHNSLSGLWVPMLGILCDGTHFEFFAYDSSTRSFALSEPMKRLEQFQSDVEFLRSIKRS